MWISQLYVRFISFRSAPPAPQVDTQKFVYSGVIPKESEDMF